MIIGNYSSTISSKRRCAIPRKILKEFGSSLVVTRWYENCLVLVGINSWQALFKRLTAHLKIATQKVRDIDRFLLGAAYEVEPDSQGRVILPQYLVDWAGLKHNLKFIGLGDRVEIWEEEVWRNREKYINENAEELIEKLAKEEKKS